MNAIDARLRGWLIWMVPFAVIALVIGWETHWGNALRRVPSIDAPVAAQPVAITLIPEYRIEGGTESMRETVERTLFNPTRRPAPPQQSAAAKPTFQRGLFVLTGTTVVDNKAIALLREVNGGRSRRVQQGETINGVTVAEVRSDRVKLTLGGESEELVLKVAAGPRTTVQPAVAAAQPGTPPGGAGVPSPGAPPGQPAANQSPLGAPAVPPPPAPPQGAPVQQPQVTPAQAAQPPQSQPGVSDVADIIGSRRRAARAAEAAGGAAPPAQ